MRKTIYSDYNYIDEAENTETEGRWISLHGTHVKIDKSGQIIGNDELKAKIEKTSKVKVNNSLSKTLAGQFREFDLKELPKKTEFVKNGMSLDVKPVEKESYDIAKAMKKSGCKDRKLAEKAGKLASDVFDKARKVEPQITNDVVGVVGALGGKMFGLAYRYKQSTSMGRKILKDASEEGISIEESAKNIKDAVRYTAIFDKGNFVDSYNKTKSELEAKGYKEVRCKNFYAKYENGKSCQKAVQCVYQNKDGYKFELQFHTIESQSIKEINHPLYERQRDKSTPKQEQDVLYERMKNLGEKVPNPDNIMSIKEHG